MADRAARRNRAKWRDLQDEVSKVFVARGGSGVRGRPGCEVLVGHMGSWFRHVEHGAAAVRVLHDIGLGNHAAPIRRSIIEHATLLAAMAVEPEGFTSEVRAFQNETRRLQAALSGLGIEPGEGIEQMVSFETDESTKKLDFKVSKKERFKSLGETGRRYHAEWRRESALSHASYATAAIYLAATPGDDWPTLAPVYQVPAGGWVVDMAVADALIMSLDAFSAVVEGDLYRADVERLTIKRDALFTEAERIGTNKDLDPPHFWRLKSRYRSLGA